MEQRINAVAFKPSMPAFYPLLDARVVASEGAHDASVIVCNGNGLGELVLDDIFAVAGAHIGKIPIDTDSCYWNVLLDFV